MMSRRQILAPQPTGKNFGGNPVHHVMKAMIKQIPVVRGKNGENPVHCMMKATIKQIPVVISLKIVSGREFMEFGVRGPM